MSSESPVSVSRETQQTRFWDFGETVEGYTIPVFNEREVRASAGILFLLGILGYMTALLGDSLRPMQAFAVLFLVDMFIRLFVTPRLSPTMLLAKLLVYRQRPEWVGAPQKRVAWGLGLGLALLSCASLGILGFPVIVAFVLCGLCLALLFLETAFGICVGCELSRTFSREKPLYCAGDACTYDSRA